MASHLATRIATLTISAIIALHPTLAFGQELGTSDWNSDATEISTFCKQELGKSSWNTGCDMPKIVLSQDESENTEANIPPAADNAPAFSAGMTFSGEWKTEGLAPDGKPYAPLPSNITIDLVQANKGILLYGWGQGKTLDEPQPIAVVIEGKTLTWGDMSRGINFPQVLCTLNENQTLSCNRQVRLKDKEGNEYVLTSTIEMIRKTKNDAG